MDFQSVNPLNVRLNKLSGNLLPMTSDDKMFSSAWRVYSAALIVLELTQISVMIPGMFSVPASKGLQDLTVPCVVLAEVGFLLFRMQTHRSLVSRLIGKLNDILLVEDKTMERIVKSTMRSVETPLKYYWIIGCAALVLWYGISIATVIFKRDYFFYEDYRVPLVISKQPFSTNIFILGDILGCLSTVCIFIRKNALDVYMINILLLMRAQYLYTAEKLATVFRERTPQSQRDGTRERCSSADVQVEMEMKILCRHHSALVQMAPMLKKLLSMNSSLIYLINVFRFCFLGCMAVTAISSFPLLEIVSIFMYSIGGLVQLYILCSCVHLLSEASTETTNEAFHEKWYQFEPSTQRLFLLMMMGNNLECRLAAFEMFNLTLPSFMTILNQAYSIALLLIRMK